MNHLTRFGLIFDAQKASTTHIFTMPKIAAPERIRAKRIHRFLGHDVLRSTPPRNVPAAGGGKPSRCFS